MAKLPRVLQKIFGSTAGATQIGVFGSLAAGAPATTANPLTVQSLANFLAGWFSAIVGSNSPAIEDMNALFFLLTYQLAYGYQAGIPEYDATTTYYIGSDANDGLGNIYTCLVDNTLNVPLTNTTTWRRINGPNTVSINPATQSPYTLVAADRGKVFLVNTANGAMTFNMPAAVLNFMFEVKDSAGNAAINNITMVRNGSESIEGTAGNYVISEDWAAKEFDCDGTNWYLTIGAKATTRRSIVKAGMVSAWAGASIPTGWFLCDGSPLVQATYPQLFASIGSTWNTCTNPLTGSAYSAPAGGSFRLPDLRSAFLRGAGGGANAAGVTTSLAGFQVDTTAKNGLAVSVVNNAVNSLGMNGNITHSHTSSGNFLSFTGGTLQTNNYASGTQGFRTNVNTDIASIDHTHSVTSNVTVTLGTGDSESRPDNVGIQYIIKVWDES